MVGKRLRNGSASAIPLLKGGPCHIGQLQHRICRAVAW